MSAAIEVRGLRKDYRAGLGGREVKALSGIDFAVQPGELFGLLGPNGAGKTTTVKILLGLTHATAGSAALLGRPVSPIRRAADRKSTRLNSSHLGISYAV